MVKEATQWCSGCMKEVFDVAWRSRKMLEKWSICAS